jgi:hypothetical protein
MIICTLGWGHDLQVEDVTVIDDAKLQDGMQTRWDAEAVRRHVDSAATRLQPSLVCILCHCMRRLGSSRPVLA